MYVKNSSVTKYWSIDASGKKTEQEQLREHADVALKIIERLPASTKSPTEQRRYKKVFKNLTIALRIATSTPNFILNKNLILNAAKMAGKLLCKNDEKFKEHYVNDETTDPRSYKSLENNSLLSQWLHSNSVDLLMDAYQYEKDSSISFTINELKRDCIYFVKKWGKLNNHQRVLTIQMLHLLSEKCPSVWEQPNLSKLFEMFVNLHGFTQLWKFAQWYLKADHINANNQDVRDNLNALINMMRHGPQAFAISANELSELYERLMHYETRKIERIEAQIWCYTILVEKTLDWKNCNKTTERHYLEAMANKCKISNSLVFKNQESIVSTAAPAISSTSLNRFISRSGLYKQNETSQLQWKLWAENIALPELKDLSLSPRAFRENWLRGICSHTTIWKNCLKNMDEAKELDSLSLENKIYYMQNHAPSLYYPSTSLLLKYLFLAIDSTLKNENENSVEWVDDLNQLSEETQIRIAQFWLSGERTLASFPPMDMPILNELMPRLIRLYPLKSREKAILQTLKTTADTKFVCKDGQTIACHRAFVESELPNLPWIDDMILECPELSRDALAESLLTKIYGLDIDLIQKESSHEKREPLTSSSDDFAKIVEFVEKHGNKLLLETLLHDKLENKISEDFLLKSLLDKWSKQSSENCYTQSNWQSIIKDLSLALSADLNKPLKENLSKIIFFIAKTTQNLDSALRFFDDYLGEISLYR